MKLKKYWDNVSKYSYNSEVENIAYESFVMFGNFQFKYLPWVQLSCLSRINDARQMAINIIMDLKSAMRVK